MKRQVKEPKTLQEAIIFFADADRCLDYLALRRWPDGMPVCPVCGRKDAKFLANQRKWQCKSVHHHRQFSVKIGTIFEDSPIQLEKWFPAVWVIVNCKNGISSYEVARDLGVTQKTAWFMLHRIRKAMQTGSFVKKMGGDGGEVEVDETYIGGKARNMHLSVKQRRITGVLTDDKTTVMGFLERGGKVRTEVVRDRHMNTVQPMVKKNVQAGSVLYSDELGGYKGLVSDYKHQVINHAVKYVDGRVHTNGIENFWSLLKRGISGTCRYNNRATKDNPMTDADRFSLALSQIAGKRLTFAEVTGKVGETPF
jgi:transposase-like protein